MDQEPAPRALWVLSEIELPPHGGSAVYTRGLMDALVRQGVSVSAFGISRSTAPHGSAIDWRLVAAQRRRGVLLPAFSRLPLMSARLPVRMMRPQLVELLGERWNVVIISHIMSVWALKPVLRAKAEGLIGDVWYAAQNDEARVWKESLELGTSSWVERLARAWDLPKVQRAQQRLLSGVSIVTTITESDRAALSQGSKRTVVASPGVSTPPGRWLRPAAARPRAVVIAGSLTWRLKLKNLEEFLRSASTSLQNSEIGVVIAGKMQQADMLQLRAQYPWADVRGELDDLRSIYDLGRLAVVPEALGGGFKLKILDYVYSGLAIVSMPCAMEGLPLVADKHYAGGSDAGALIQSVIELIDDCDRIDALAHSARSACEEAFDWDRTGSLLAGLMGGHATKEEMSS